MKRSWQTWLVFLICLTVVTAALGWISMTTLKLEWAEAQASRQSENERLALWRMETAMMPLIMQESARPQTDYSTLTLIEDAYSRMLAPIPKGEVQSISSLLTIESPYILLHFQCDSAGNVTSPQVPLGGNAIDLAESKYLTPERLAFANEELDSLKEKVKLQDLTIALRQNDGLLDLTSTVTLQANEQPEPFGNNAEPPIDAQPVQQPTQPNPESQQASDFPQQYSFPQQAEVGPGRGGNYIAQRLQQVTRQQQEKSVKEYQRRSNWTNNTAGNDFNNDLSKAEDEIPQGPMKAAWVNENLLLIRHVQTEEGEKLVQGCVLDWPEIRTTLIEEIKDLLPGSELQPVHAMGPIEHPLMLASLPVRLTPGLAPQEQIPLLTPLRFTLVLAWMGVLLAAFAVAALLLAAVRLGERRGAFVSAVTHELRTPLTTFRLYTEMLEEGMVQTEEKQQTYLHTMRLEADRLGHMVENVLSYSKLEATSTAATRESISLNEELQRMVESLSEVAARAGMELDYQPPAEDEQLTVKVDTPAVERILFNLTDNATKYGNNPDTPQIHIECVRVGKLAHIRVRDHGKGVQKREAKKLFRPFSKSAREAAHTAPGVGLGLALCRRLARNMGGDLTIDHSIKNGACFVLSLPLCGG